MSNKLKAQVKKQATEPSSTSALEESFAKEERSRLVVDIPRNLHRWFKVTAAENDRDLRDLVIDALTDYTNRDQYIKNHMSS